MRLSAPAGEDEAVTREPAAWVEVDLDAIATNVRALKALTPPGCLLMAVVKADGYGHGSVQAAREALSAGADRLGVATVEEAQQIRMAGIPAPVHLLSEPPPRDAATVVEHHLVPALYTREFGEALSSAAVGAGRLAPFHLKVDTGMNRIGVRAEEACALVRAVRVLPGLALEGVFTHFATADDPAGREFVRQVERFDGAVRGLRADGIDVGLVHAANSAAAILQAGVHYDMVRCGITLYGLHPSSATCERIRLVPAMSVKARVSLVKRIGAGEGVSYGFTYHARAPETIATLPLGYADGVHRTASNKMAVIINGAVCRQVGLVCMDQLLAVVPEGIAVRAGDEAVLIGTQGQAEIPMDALARAAGTVNYETACAFAMRLPRRYVRGGRRAL